MDSMSLIAVASIVTAGVTMGISALGRMVTDPAFEPIYAELDRRRAVLLLHPAGSGCCSPFIANHGLTWPIGAPMEDTIFVTHLIATVEQVPQTRGLRRASASDASAAYTANRHPIVRTGLRRRQIV